MHPLINFDTMHSCHAGAWEEVFASNGAVIAKDIPPPFAAHSAPGRTILTSGAGAGATAADPQYYIDAVSPSYTATAADVASPNLGMGIGSGRLPAGYGPSSSSPAAGSGAAPASQLQVPLSSPAAGAGAAYRGGNAPATSSAYGGPELGSSMASTTAMAGSAVFAARPQYAGAGSAALDVHTQFEEAIARVGTLTSRLSAQQQQQSAGQAGVGGGSARSAASGTTAEPLEHSSRASNFSAAGVPPTPHNSMSTSRSNASAAAGGGAFDLQALIAESKALTATVRAKREESEFSRSSQASGTSGPLGSAR